MGNIRGKGVERMRALITGINGFAGSHLAELLLSEGYEVFGLIRRRADLTNIQHILKQLTLVEGDLTDRSSLLQLLKSSKPDLIFHLAAQSFVPTSWRLPVETFNTNVLGEINLFEAIRELGLEPRIQVAGSSEEYGLVYEDEIPIKETNPLRPLSPYAVSKVAQDLLGYQYYKSYGMRIVRTRAFNHTGPRRGAEFVVSNFAKQIAEIEKKKRPPVLKVGNLKAVRDFTDVRDTVKAYLSVVLKGKDGEVYNIASGRGVAIETVLKTLLELSPTEIKVEVDPERLRPSDVPILIGDYSKVKEETGWSPTIPFKKTLEDVLEFWRERT